LAKPSDREGFGNRRYSLLSRTVSCPAFGDHLRRGEFEFVPADSLADRNIEVLFEPPGIVIPAEVRGVRAQGKPRLRKFDANNKAKFHLPQLVMAVARLPEPAREDLSPTVSFPLENKQFVMNGMDFDIIEDDGVTVTLAPLRVTIRHTDFQIELQDRLTAIAKDIENIESIRQNHPVLAKAIEAHHALVIRGVNTRQIRTLADRIVSIQTDIFGATNVGSASILEEMITLPETEAEADIKGKEGRLLTRVHVYKERDVKFARLAKTHYKKLGGGVLLCNACDTNPVTLYGVEGERAIEAHHKVPIAQLQPDSVTTVHDVVMVCATCHRVIHSKNPCLTVEELRLKLGA